MEDGGSTVCHMNMNGDKIKKQLHLHSRPVVKLELQRISVLDACPGKVC